MHRSHSTSRCLKHVFYKWWVFNDNEKEMVGGFFFLNGTIQRNCTWIIAHTFHPLNCLLIMSAHFLSALMPPCFSELFSFWLPYFQTLFLYSTLLFCYSLFMCASSSHCLFVWFLCLSLFVLIKCDIIKVREI